MSRHVVELTVRVNLSVDEGTSIQEVMDNLGVDIFPDENIDDSIFDKYSIDGYGLRKIEEIPLDG